MDNYKWWIIEQKTHGEILSIFADKAGQHPWCRYFLKDPPLSPANLNSRCRIGYSPFDLCKQDRYYYTDTSYEFEKLAAGGITTQIEWDNSKKNLPQGWQDAVKKSYLDSLDRKKEPNTMVALLAFTTQKYRGKNLSELVITKMIEMARKRKYDYLIIPALPPSQFEKDKIELGMDELSDIKTKENKFHDYWVRLHLNKGGKIINFCNASHRFVFTCRDFFKHVSSMPVNNSGEHSVRLDKDIVLGSKGKDMWQKIYADIDRDFITFNWGCIWIKYDITN